MSPALRTFSSVGAAALLALLLLSLPSSAMAADRDCGDFGTQRAAQIFYLKHGGPRYDPHRLDADDDGIACEDNSCPCYFKKRLPKRSAPYIAVRRPLTPAG